MSTAREDRIKGVLLGQAAGDALGSHYEFGRPSEGHAEMLTGTFGHEPGEWTDDTQLATCIAAAHSDPDKTARYILDWYLQGPLDVGNSTARLLSTVSRTGLPMAEMSREQGERQAAFVATQRERMGWDPGMANGSLMRTGPACLPHLGSRDKIAEVARTLSDLTHYDPDGWTGDACVIWSLAIDRAIEMGAGLDVYAELRSAVGEYIPAERWEFWMDVIAGAFTDTQTPKRNGSAVAAFKCALSAVAHAESLEDGLQRAVAMGDDTDTVAAIAGALLGAIYGASAIPETWRKMLHGWTPRGTMGAAGLEALALEAAGHAAGIS